MMMKTCDGGTWAEKGMNEVAVSKFECWQPRLHLLQASGTFCCGLSQKPFNGFHFLFLIITRYSKVVWPCVRLSGLFARKDCPTVGLTPAPLCSYSGGIAMGLSGGGQARSVPGVGMTPGTFSIPWVWGTVLAGSRGFWNPPVHPARPGSPVL